MKDDGDSEVSDEVQLVTSGSPLLLGMVIILHALNHLINGSLPVLYPSIMQEFHLSYVQLGFLRSASSFASGFPQMFVGFLRRWLPGRVLIALGNILNSVMTMFARALASGLLAVSVGALSTQLAHRCSPPTRTLRGEAGSSVSTWQYQHWHLRFHL